MVFKYKIIGVAVFWVKYIFLFVLVAVYAWLFTRADIALIRRYAMCEAHKAPGNMEVNVLVVVPPMVWIK